MSANPLDRLDDDDRETVVTVALLALGIGIAVGIVLGSIITGLIVWLLT